MILELADIKRIITENPNQSLITKARDAARKLRMHLYGENMEGEIKPIDGHEKQALRDIRAKYAVSNKDLFTRLARPIDKVFSAKGGSVYYNLSDALNKQAVAASANVTSGLSCKKYVENVWKAHFLDDPNGIILMEWDTERCYPTYVSSSDIFDYQLNGNRLEYLVTKLSAAQKSKYGIDEKSEAYRVYDDAFDYTVTRSGENITVLPVYTFENPFEHVPAILNSDFSDPQCTGLALSLFSDVIELADNFLQTGSIRELAKIRLAYPKYWQFATACPSCKGTKYVEGKTCGTCNGSGKAATVVPGDHMILDWPEKDDVNVVPNVAGFVEHPTAYFDNSKAELADLENAMALTIWGAESKRRPTGPTVQGQDVAKTATEIIDEIQPKVDRLTLISEQAERRHKFIIDHIIICQIQQNYGGASVNYGRRYMLESSDAIWTKYQDARQKGASGSILDDILIEYVETKYSGDPVGLAIQMKLLAVEPFIHNTAMEVKNLGAPAPDFLAKLYFSDWLATVQDTTLISSTAEELKKQLAEYVAGKQVQQPTV